MANNKIVLSDGTVLLDLSSDTVKASDVAQGKTFHLADGTQATGTASSGGGKTVTQVACGSMTQSSTVSSSSNNKLTDTTEIGFTPTHFYAWRDGVSTTRYHINSLTYDKQGSSYTRKTSYRGSNSMTSSGNTNNWTTQTSGYLYFNNNTVYVRSSSSYIFPSGTWYWVATGDTPNIS